jgi:hypothetical protein
LPARIISKDIQRPFFLTPTKPKFLELWGPRVGDDAARIKYQSAQCQWWASLSSIVWFTSLAVGGGLHVRALVIVGAVTLCACAVLIGLSLARLHEAKTVAGRCLWMTLRGWPPLEADAYETWCCRHKLTPYAANARDAYGTA